MIRKKKKIISQVNIELAAVPYRFRNEVVLGPPVLGEPATSVNGCVKEYGGGYKVVGRKRIISFPPLLLQSVMPFGQSCSWNGNLSFLQGTC